ncbi:plasmid pRiA4b ORF-3 family protein [Actinoallomurus purpureus]|uniref:plasmid pRiA4b ORF-3 family protein n=1 Tax=Actinoallomurus purpureus TaxID=478114 RepID=UPI002093AB67|nr:plasmid pRiA4b ORF-3 family protein [Actinoallomurus purpureus]MCO6008317.1 plasmid pRiA4b ORF-3 family protein [Actinoallomurus purpureus]
MPRRAVVHTPDLSSEQLASAARACPVLATAQTLAEWVGAGREVTARGVLRPAAAVEACDLLGIEVPSRKPRSALDIDELMMAWAAASAAGFIEVTGGRVRAGAALQAWLDGASDTVLAVWSRCVLESLGLVGETEEADLDYLVALATLHEGGGVASLADLGASITELIGDASPGCPCPDCTPQPGYPDGIFLGFPGDLGIEVDAEDTVQALGEFGIAALRGDVAELTPLGRWLTDVIFRKSAPPADIDAAALVGALAQLPAMVAVLMARPWLSARTPAAAARELLTAGESTSGQERLTALDLARECGPQAAPAWREWAAKDGFGAYARVWLAEQDDSEPADADAAWITVDTLVTALDALPPELPVDLLPALLQSQVGDEVAEVLPLLGDCGHPDAPRLVKLLSGGPTNPARPPVDTGVGASAQAPVLRLVRADPGDAGPVPPRRPDRSAAGYQIKVQLLGVTKPPVWRRLQVPADVSLDRLHEVIQAAMGWENSHLHMFSDGRSTYGLPDRELDHRDERKVSLSQLLTSVGDKIRYTYDFGDGWEHDVVLEKVLAADAGVTGPVCAAGKGACPPEDCGGVWGYEELKATLADPDAEEHQNRLEWLGLASGDDFDPKQFSAEEINRRLGRSS